MLCYSVTKDESWENIDNWIKNIRFVIIHIFICLICHQYSIEGLNSILSENDLLSHDFLT